MANGYTENIINPISSGNSGGSGIQKYTVVITGVGDVDTESRLITHNLGTTAVTFLVRDTVSNEIVTVDVDSFLPNSFVLHFDIGNTVSYSYEITVIG